MSETQCQAVVWKKDPVPRYTGRPGKRYEAAWRKRRCERRTGAGGLCWQHAAKVAAGRRVERWGER